MSFNEKYRNILNLVKEDIQKVEKELLAEIFLSNEINETLKTFLTNKPKRIRPLVSFLYLRASNIEPVSYTHLTGRFACNPYQNTLAGICNKTFGKSLDKSRVNVFKDRRFTVPVVRKNLFKFSLQIERE